MLNVRLAAYHQYEKLLFTWLSLMMSLMMSFCADFSLEIFWMRFGTELSQFLRVFLSTLARLFLNPIKVNNFAYIFDCTTVGRASD